MKSGTNIDRNKLTRYADRLDNAIFDTLRAVVYEDKKFFSTIRHLRIELLKIENQFSSHLDDEQGQSLFAHYQKRLIDMMQTFSRDEPPGCRALVEKKIHETTEFLDSLLIDETKRKQFVKLNILVVAVNRLISYVTDSIKRLENSRSNKLQDLQEYHSLLLPLCNKLAMQPLWLSGDERENEAFLYGKIKEYIELYHEIYAVASVHRHTAAIYGNLPTSSLWAPLPQSLEEFDRIVGPLPDMLKRATGDNESCIAIVQRP